MTEAKPMSWLMILLILLGVSAVSGFLFLGAGSEIGIPSSWRGWLYAVVMGVVAAFLVTRRRIAVQKGQSPAPTDDD